MDGSDDFLLSSSDEEEESDFHLDLEARRNERVVIAAGAEEDEDDGESDSCDEVGSGDEADEEDETEEGSDSESIASKSAVPVRGYRVRNAIQRDGAFLYEIEEVEEVEPEPEIITIEDSEDEIATVASDKPPLNVSPLPEQTEAAVEELSTKESEPSIMTERSELIVPLPEEPEPAVDSCYPKESIADSLEIMPASPAQSPENLASATNLQPQVGNLSFLSKESLKLYNVEVGPEAFFQSAFGDLLPSSSLESIASLQPIPNLVQSASHNFGFDIGMDTSLSPSQSPPLRLDQVACSSDNLDDLEEIPPPEECCPDPSPSSQGQRRRRGRQRKLHCSPGQNQRRSTRLSREEDRTSILRQIENDMAIIIQALRIHRVYYCSLCVRCDFVTQDEYFSHFYEDHNFRKLFEPELYERGSDEEFDYNPTGVELYEKIFGLIPGRVKMNESLTPVPVAEEAAATESDWMDLDGTDLSSDSDSEGEFSCRSDNDPDYITCGLVKGKTAKKKRPKKVVANRRRRPKNVES